MNRFQQVATFRKSSAALGVGDRVVVDGKPATVALVYCQDGRQSHADIVEDGGAEWCVPVANMQRVASQD